MSCDGGGCALKKAWRNIRAIFLLLRCFLVVNLTVDLWILDSLFKALVDRAHEKIKLATATVLSFAC
jgi:hypothetical protein